MKCLEPHDREIIKDHAIINSFICYFSITSKWVFLGDVLTHFFQTTYCSIFCSHFIKPESRQFIHINSWATKRNLRQFVKNHKGLFYQRFTFYFFLIPSFLPHLTHFFNAFISHHQHFAQIHQITHKSTNYPWFKSPILSHHNIFDLIA